MVLLEWTERSFQLNTMTNEKYILNHTPLLNKIPSQSHRIILWPSKSLRISQPFHLENSPKNSWREYSWVIWCFGPLGKFRFLWHSYKKLKKLFVKRFPDHWLLLGNSVVSNKQVRMCCGWVNLTGSALSHMFTPPRPVENWADRGAAVSCHL